jgi:hypothetical protein
MAVADWNGDGAPDLMINCNDGPAVASLNPRSGRWIAIALRGTKSNRDGIGAVVRVTTPAGRKQRVFVSAGGSYLSASETIARFGLGAEERAASVEVEWPSGARQTVGGLAGGQIHLVVEPR